MRPIVLGVANVVDEIRSRRRQAERDERNRGVDEARRVADAMAENDRGEDQKVLRPVQRSQCSQHWRRCYIARVKNEQRWRAAMWIAITVWAVLCFRMMIADVWDETNGMLYFSDPHIALATKVHFALTQSLGFYRPLATLTATLFMHFIPSFDWSWRVLRLVNMLMIVGTLLLLIDAMENWLRGGGRLRPPGRAQRDFVAR